MINRWLMSRLQNSWTAIGFPNSVSFGAETAAHGGTMHLVSPQKQPRTGIAAYPPRVLQLALIATAMGTLTLMGCSSDEPASTAVTKSKPSISGSISGSAAHHLQPSKMAATSTTAVKKTQGSVVGKVGTHLFTDQNIDAVFTQMPTNFQKMKNNPAMRANILNNLMTRFALTEKAQQLGIAKDPVIRNKIERAQSSILLQELNKRQRSKMASHSDQELKAYYDSNIARFTTPAGRKPFEQVKKQISNTIEQQNFRNWVKAVKQEMKFTIVDPRYQRRHPQKTDANTPPAGR